MYVTTFYSFKGGVGRTMALVNTAVTLALKGRRVLVVDFDIEAPGLDTFDVLKPQEEVSGVIDFVTQYLESGQSPDISDFISECPVIGDQGGSLWIMPSGKKDTYAANFNQIDWGYLYEKHAGFFLFEDIKAQWEKVLEPDYVLIDSRTGHTDTSGICTRQLPDAVIVLFFPNEQNLRGLIDVVRDIRAERNGIRKKDIELHFVMSNVPDLDDEDQILESKIKAFQNQLGFRQTPMVVHRYDSLSLLNQAVFSKDRPKSRLAKEYQKIVREIVVCNWNDRDGALEYIQRVRQPRRWRDRGWRQTHKEMIDNIQKAHRNDGEVLFHLSELKESYRDPESAFSLIGQAIDAGYDEPEAYLKRSRFRQQNTDPDGASEDIWWILERDHVSPFVLREAISRLMKLGTYQRKKVINSPAVLSLETDDKLWIADELNHSVEEASFAVFLLETTLDDSELSESERESMEYDLGMSYMALGRCAEAARMFRGEDKKNISDLAIALVFNYAMALWGKNETVQPDIFQRVIDLHCSRPPKEEELNYLQCMAIAYWAVGDNGRALDCLQKVQSAVHRFRGPTEFSCWCYLQVSLEIFKEDLDQIHILIEDHASLMPKFMRDVVRDNVL